MNAKETRSEVAMRLQKPKRGVNRIKAKGKVSRALAQFDADTGRCRISEVHVLANIKWNLH